MIHTTHSSTVCTHTQTNKNKQTNTHTHTHTIPAVQYKQVFVVQLNHLGLIVAVEWPPASLQPSHQQRQARDGEQHKKMITCRES